MKTLTIIGMLLIASTTWCAGLDYFLFLTYDASTTNLCWFWEGKTLTTTQAESKIKRPIVREFYNSYGLHFRVAKCVSLEDFLFSMDMLKTGGITNVVLQVVSNPIPRAQVVKRDILLRIEDYSHEPAVVAPHSNFNGNIRKEHLLNGEREDKKKTVDAEDLPVDNNGL